MNKMYEQEIRYRLLRVLSQDTNLSQRDMAKCIGISLGKINFCLSELAENGMIKVNRFKSAKKKIPYTYMLTPFGLEEKAKLTLTFLKRKLAEYEEIKHQIRELAREVGEEKFEVMQRPF